MSLTRERERERERALTTNTILRSRATKKNRFPALHFLREADVSLALEQLDGDDDTAKSSEITTRNIEQMRRLGADNMRDRLRSCFVPAFDAATITPPAAQAGF